MLLKDLYQIVKIGSDKPLILWLKDFQKLAKKILPRLEEVEKKITPKTETRNRVKLLVKLFQEENPNELALAENLFFIAELFKDQKQKEHEKLINDYISCSKKFFEISHLSEIHRRVREGLIKKLSKKEKQEYDFRLFKEEGLIYCLEYCLAVYNAIENSKSRQKKVSFIVSSEIDLGMGKLPGLYTNLDRDNILSKFIYSILDDNVRLRLIKAYFYAKILIMRVNISLEEKGYKVTYNKVTLEEIIEAFKEFIQILLATFQEMGIEKLSTLAFPPFTNKSLKNIKI